MIRLFHTADWHLGHHLHGVSRQLEHQQFLDWLLQELQSRQIDALIVAGDIFDSANPSAAAQSQLYDFLVKARARQPNLDIVLVGGNHDSASRLDAPSPILNALGVSVIGGLSRDDQGNIEWDRLLVPLTDAAGETQAWCGAMPFVRNADLPSTAMDGGSVAIGQELMRPTAMDGGSVAIGRELMRPTAMDGGSVAIGREPMRPTARDGGHDSSRQSQAFPPSLEVRSDAIAQEPIQSGEQGSDPLITGMKTLYAELFARLQEKAGNGDSLILTGHCYMVNGVLSELSERKILGGNQHALPVELFPDAVDYVALGHLHLAQRVGANEHIRYSGSPIPLSFDEIDYSHQVIQVEINERRQVETTAVKIPRSVQILRIPNGKEFAVLPEVIGQLENLILDDLPLEQRPLLELRIRLEKPEPGLRQQIEEVIGKLPVRLLKISTAYCGSEKSLADVRMEERLEELHPLDVFQRCYQNKYDQEAPEVMKTLFNGLVESLQGTE